MECDNCGKVDGVNRMKSSYGLNYCKDCYIEGFHYCESCGKLSPTNELKKSTDIGGMICYKCQPFHNLEKKQLKDFLQGG